MAHRIRALIFNLQRELAHWCEVDVQYEAERIRQQIDHWRRELALAEGFRGGHSQFCG